MKIVIIKFKHTPKGRVNHEKENKKQNSKLHY